MEIKDEETLKKENINITDYIKEFDESAKNVIVIKDKNQGTRTYTIDEAINSSNFEMNKRIEYAQKIFTKIININSNKN